MRGCGLARPFICSRPLPTMARWAQHPGRLGDGYGRRTRKPRGVATATVNLHLL